MMDDSPDTPPEVTIEPADNGFVVRHHRRSGKKDEPGRTIRRVASTDDEALAHAKSALNGGRTPKKKSSRDGHATAEAEEPGVSSAAHGTAHGTAHSGSRHRVGTRRRRPRAVGRRA
jgi:hypothetical protein